MATNVIWTNRVAELTGEYKGESIVEKVKGFVSSIVYAMGPFFGPASLDYLESDYRSSLTMKERANTDADMFGVHSN